MSWSDLSTRPVDSRIARRGALLRSGTLLTVLALGLGVSGGAAQETATDTGSAIFFHPDGMGANQWGAVRMATVGPDGRLQWDHLEHLAVYLGHLENALVATSHGGATVHAYGVKVLADSYGMNGREPLTARSGHPLSLLQEARAAGLAVGLVNSGTITEPGSGVFAASVPEREMHDAIARRILDSGAEVILGGGERWFLPRGARGVHGDGARGDGADLIAEARERGYTVVRTRQELLSLPDTVGKVLGLFASVHTFDARSEEALARGGRPLYEPGTPTIAEMTRAALEIFARGGRRFFLVAEEEGTDNFGNSNNARGVIEAGRRADEAIGVIRSFIERHPRTLMVTTSDSDAGGLQVLGPTPETAADFPRVPERDANGAPLDGRRGTGSEPFVAAPDAGGARLPFVIAWATRGDVSGGIVARATGLGSERLHGTVDNTAIYRILYRVLFGREPGGTGAEPGAPVGPERPGATGATGATGGAETTGGP